MPSRGPRSKPNIAVTIARVAASQAFVAPHAHEEAPVMAIDFYAGSGSPFAWRVWLSLEHKQLPYTLKMLSFQAGDHKKPEYLAINPRHQVPAIVDDGFSLSESSAIVEYLEEQYPERAIFPKGAREKAMIRRKMLDVINHIGPAAQPLNRAILFKGEADWDQALITELRAKCVAEFPAIDALIEGPFVAGAQVGVGDYTLYPLVALNLRCDTKRPVTGLGKELSPKVHAWMKRVESLPYFDKTVPPHWK
jgi:glutathione S-transferase